MKTLWCYDDTDNVLDELKRTGLSDGRYDGPFKMIHFSFYNDAVTGWVADTVEQEAAQ